MLLDYSYERYQTNNLVMGNVRRRFAYEPPSLRNYMSLPKKKTLVTEEEEEVY